MRETRRIDNEQEWDWVEVRDANNRLVCEYSLRLHRVRTKARNGSILEARLPKRSERIKDEG